MENFRSFKIFFVFKIQLSQVWFIFLCVFYLKEHKRNMKFEIMHNLTEAHS